MLQYEKFWQQYLNIGMHHRRSLNNAQDMVRDTIRQLDILSYAKDSFYARFVKLAQIEQEIGGDADISSLQKRLDSIKDLKFIESKDAMDILEANLDSEQYKNIEKNKRLLEIKYKVSWHIAYIRLISYGKKSPSKDSEEKNSKENKRNYDEICKYAKNAEKELLKLANHFDYDFAMLYISLYGYRFIGARVHFLDSGEELQKKYQEAFEELDRIYQCALRFRGDDTEIPDDLSKHKKAIEALSTQINHPHIRAYMEYYRFLYIQRKMELAAQKGNLYDFKCHLSEAKAKIDELLQTHATYLYLLAKIKKHKANLSSIESHVELKELARQLQSPFDIESNPNDNSNKPKTTESNSNDDSNKTKTTDTYDILDKNNKLYDLIGKMIYSDSVKS